MSTNEVAATKVVAVLLADGWHRIVRGSFSVGPLDSIIAVRQVTSAVRHLGDMDLARTAHSDQRADQGARFRRSGSLKAAEG